MKTLIEDLKKVITSNIEDKDRYCEKLINGFLRERDSEQLLIQRVVDRSEQSCDNHHCQEGIVEVIYGEPLRCSNCDK